MSCSQNRLLQLNWALLREQDERMTIASTEHLEEVRYFAFCILISSLFFYIHCLYICIVYIVFFCSYVYYFFLRVVLIVFLCFMLCVVLIVFVCFMFAVCTYTPEKISGRCKPTWQ